MSFQKMVNAVCDVPDCPEMSESSGWTQAEAWEYARDAGWHMAPGYRTICPLHWEEGQR